MFHPWKCDNDPEENVLGRVSTTHIHQPDFFWPRFLTFGPVTLSPRSWRTCGRFEALAVSLSGWCDGSDLWTHTQVGALLRMSWTCKVWIWRVNPDPMLFSRFLFGRLQGPPYLIFMILVPFWLQKVKIRKQNQTFRQQDPLQGHSAPKVPKHPGRTRRAAFLCGGCRWDAQMLLGLFGAALQVCKVQMKVEASGSHDHDLAVKSCAAFLCSVVFLRAVHPDAFGVAVEKSVGIIDLAAMKYDSNILVPCQHSWWLDRTSNLVEFDMRNLVAVVRIYLESITGSPWERFEHVHVWLEGLIYPVSVDCSHCNDCNDCNVIKWIIKRS